MKPVDIIIIAVLLAILGGAIFYIRKARKKGAKCIGCPEGTKCCGNCAACGKET